MFLCPIIGDNFDSLVKGVSARGLSSCFLRGRRNNMGERRSTLWQERGGL